MEQWVINSTMINTEEKTERSFFFYTTLCGEGRGGMLEITLHALEIIPIEESKCRGIGTTFQLT